MSWTKINSGEYSKQHKGCVLRLVRERHGWVWSVTHTQFTASDYCSTLQQAKKAVVREADARLDRQGF